MTITILDGGMGQELLARTGAEPTGLWSTQVMIDFPDAVRSVHDDYFLAGSDVATTNTYAIFHDRLDPVGKGDQFEELHHQALKIAKASRDDHGAGQVAGSLGPLGWSYDAKFAPPAAEAAPLYAEIVAIHDPHVDLFLIETMSGVDQARGALMGTDGSKLPVWLSLSVDDDNGTCLRSGEPLTEAVEMASGYDVDAILLNCSKPEAISQGLDVMKETGVRFGAYANGFTSISDSFKSSHATVNVLSKRQDLGPEAYADFAETWAEKGATIIGGCCETGPAHIAEIARRPMNIPKSIQELIGRFPLGFVATVIPGGRPAVSPKGTFLVLDDETIAFGEIRSPQTISNLSHSPEVEVNFVDVFTRKGARIRGSAVIVRRGSDEFARLQPKFADIWGDLANRINAIVKISADEVKPLSTPPYDDGVTEEEMIALYKAKFAEMYP